MNACSTSVQEQYNFDSPLTVLTMKDIAEPTTGEESKIVSYAADDSEIASPRWASMLDQEPAKPTRYRVRRLLGFAKPYKWQMAGLMVAVALNSSITLVYPALVGTAIDDVIVRKNTSVLPGIVLLLVGLVIAQALLSFWQNYWSTVVGEKVVIDLRTQLYRHLQQLSLSFFQDNHTGDLLSRLTNDVMLIRNAVTDTLMGFISSIFTVLIGVIVIVAGPTTVLSQFNQFHIQIPASHMHSILNPATLWVILLVVLFTLPFLLSSVFLRRTLKKQLEILSEATRVLEETISNEKIVKAFTREDYEIQRYDTLARQQFGMVRKRAWIMGIANALSILLGLGGVAIFLWFVGNAVMNGSITIGDLAMTVIYIFIIAQPFASASNQYSQFQMALGAAERIFALLDQAVDIKDVPGASSLPQVQGHLRFEQVDFSYDGQRQVLHGVSFEARAGQVVALVGPSGAGKTTIANLIPRFFDVQHGRITLDGFDISQVQIKSLREQIGIVLQEPVLFSATIRENIAYGKLGATPEEINAVARAANANEFIEKLPQRYETLVGERGVKLSVGQRQRIAIARAVLRNPRILILDEATSSLDNESERLVQDALERLMQSRTTIVIAHRLSTIQNADTILVLEQGRVIEQGTHEELLALQERYYRLYTSIQNDVEAI
ncbi:MAG: ABC transporter ATP-binding protein [Chloroflexi bacterium]|nr:MAG: ABC transporter ATP-binding protein [Chloroflexota bacterium]